MLSQTASSNYGQNPRCSSEGRPVNFGCCFRHYCYNGAAAPCEKQNKQNKALNGLRMEPSWWEAYLAGILPQQSLPSILVAHACNPTWEKEGGGSEAQSHSWWHSEFKASLRYRDPVSKEQANKPGRCVASPCPSLHPLASSKPCFLAVPHASLSSLHT